MDINSDKYAGITQWENSFRKRMSKCTTLLCRRWGICVKQKYTLTFGGSGLSVKKECTSITYNIRYDMFRLKHVVIHLTLYSIINLLCLTYISHIILYVILVIAHNGEEPPKKECTIIACAEHEGTWIMPSEFWAINKEFSSDRLMSVQTLKSSLLSPVLFCTIFFAREMVINLKTLWQWLVLKMYLVDNQYAGGVTVNSVRNKVADYFVTDAGAASSQISKIWIIQYIK